MTDLVLQGETAIVTGGARGIGHGIAMDLAKAGVDVLVAGKEGFPHLAHYSASKFAVVGFTNALATEVAQDGITVNAICPGIVRTYMWDRLADGWNREDKESVESWVRQLLAQIPQGRAQTPEDMGRLVVFLATMDNLTGQSVNLDGGFTFH